jgi:hypothetical protein
MRGIPHTASVETTGVQEPHRVPSRIKRAVAALEHAFPADPSDAARWPRSEQLLAHVIALADAAAGVPDTGPQVIALLMRTHLLLRRR